MASPEAAALVGTPLKALTAPGGQRIVAEAMLKGIESVEPIMAVVEAQVAAAEGAARTAARGAQDHAARAARVESEVLAMLEREEARWRLVADTITSAAGGLASDDLVELLGVDGPVADVESFDELMRDPAGVLKLGPSPPDPDSHSRVLASVARRVVSPPLNESVTRAFLASTPTAAGLSNAAASGACLRGASGDLVLVGDGTCVAVRDGSYVRTPIDEVTGLERTVQLSAFRLATGRPPALTPSARAALVTCLQERRATPVSDSRTLGPYVLFGATIAGSSDRPAELARIVEVLRGLARCRGDGNAIAAALMTIAYAVFRVHVCAGDAIGSERVSEKRPAIDVGRVRRDHLADVPVFWIPMWASDADVVGGADRPWTLDIPAAGATWHSQSPVMSLDPDWYARIVVVPGDPNLWAVDPEGGWWSLSSDFERVLESRRDHIRPWLEALEVMERDVPARIETAQAHAGSGSTSDVPPSSGSGSTSQRTPKQFSKDWVLERAGRYGYQDDSAARAAGARAARDGRYSREDFLTVVRWKSARTISLAERNAAADVEQATRAAFEATDEISRVLPLVGLDGVGIPVASALLHFAFPEIYPILDFRALHSLGDSRRRTQYSPAFWVRYVERCQHLAARAGVSIRDLDKALWQESIESGPGAFRHCPPDSAG